MADGEMQAQIEALGQQIQAIQLNQPHQQQQVEAPQGRAPNIRDDNIAAPPGDAEQMKMGRHALRALPRYDRKTPWRTFICEFKSWVEMNDLYTCGDEFLKNALVGAMKGQAMDMVNLHRRGYPTYTNARTWRDYVYALEHIFAPPAESQLAKEEFKNYKQKPMEDVSSYLATKRSLWEVAYYQNGQSTGNFDNYLDEIILGLCNKEVKLQLRRANPRTKEEIEQVLIRIVANERAAYEQGYSRSETKDGLYHTTIMQRRQNTEHQTEAMDITALRNQVKAMESQMEENINAIKEGKHLDKSKITCYKCQKKGHFAKECRSRPGGGQYQGRGGGPNRHSGGKFPFDCHYCKKKGHKKSDCFKFKKDKQAGKVREMDEDKPEDDNSSGYSRFLGPAGETETN